MGDFEYNSLKDINFGAVNSGAGFLVKRIGTSAMDIRKEVRIYK
jgi:hypothetical protein